MISAIAIARQGKFEVQEMPEATAFSWKDFDRDVVEKTPAELLPEDKNARVGVIYEAEAALLKGKYVKKQHRNQTGIFLVKETGIASSGIYLPVWHRFMPCVLNI